MFCIIEVSTKDPTVARSQSRYSQLSAQQIRKYGEIRTVLEREYSSVYIPKMTRWGKEGRL